jgi:hypothetical protein
MSRDAEIRILRWQKNGDSSHFETDPNRLGRWPERTGSKAVTPKGIGHPRFILSQQIKWNLDTIRSNLAEAAVCFKCVFIE